MTRRPEQQYPNVHYRLEQWAQWVISQGPGRVGWNVYTGDSTDNIRVQGRNDVHSDKPYAEVSGLQHSERVARTTDQAWRELPQLWRRLIYLTYVQNRRILTVEIARTTGIDRRHVNTHIMAAFAELGVRLQELRSARLSVAV